MKKINLIPYKSVAKYINFNIIKQLLILYRKAEHQPISFTFFQPREGKPEKKKWSSNEPSNQNFIFLGYFYLTIIFLLLIWISYLEETMYKSLSSDLW